MSSSSSKSKLTCSRHDIAEKLLSWRSTIITHSLYIYFVFLCRTFSLYVFFYVFIRLSYSVICDAVMYLCVTNFNFFYDYCADIISSLYVILYIACIFCMCSGFIFICSGFIFICSGFIFICSVYIFICSAFICICCAFVLIWKLIYILTKLLYLLFKYMYMTCNRI